MPASSSSHKAEFIPSPPMKSRFGNLSWGSRMSAERADSAKRASEGKTRRMLRDEGYPVEVPNPAYTSGTATTDSVSSPKVSAGRRRGAGLNGNMAFEPAF